MSLATLMVIAVKLYACKLAASSSRFSEIAELHLDGTKLARNCSRRDSAEFCRRKIRSENPPDRANTNSSFTFENQFGRTSHDGCRPNSDTTSAPTTLDSFALCDLASDTFDFPLPYYYYILNSVHVKSPE